jgi:hypothetical protein
MPHFVFDENNNRVEAYSAQEVLAIIEQAIADGSLANVVAGSAFVTKLKCCVSGQTNYVAFTTQATYNEMEANGTLVQNCYYFIIDDTTAEDMARVLETMQLRIVELENSFSETKAGAEEVLETMQLHIVGIEDGTIPAQHANNADKATTADKATALAVEPPQEMSFNLTAIPSGYNYLAIAMGSTRLNLGLVYWEQGMNVDVPFTYAEIVNGVAENKFARLYISTAGYMGAMPQEAHDKITKVYYRKFPTVTGAE